MNVDVAVISVFVDESGAFGNELGIIVADDATAGREQELATRLGFSETIFLDGGGAIRIFTPATELPFAGHPCVGAAWWLARAGTPVPRLDVPAGPVDVRVDGDVTWIAAQAAWTRAFDWSEVDSPAALAALDPGAVTHGHTYAYVWLDRARGHIGSRMFAPAMGIREDQATGAAAIRLTDVVGQDLTITQGLGSRLRTHRLADGRIEVGGRCRYDRNVVA